MLPLASFFDELQKIATVTPDQARRAMDRLDQLEATKPTAGQVARYAGVGALAGPVIGGISNAIEGGKPVFGQSPMRGILGAAAKGALSAGAVPLMNRALDQHAQKRTLKTFVQQE